MVFLDFITNVLNAFDYAFSLVAEIARLPYNNVTNLVFNASSPQTFNFTTLISNLNVSFTFPKLPILGDIFNGIFQILFGWTPYIFGFNMPFIVNIILGSVGNVFFITIIHWVVKFCDMLF